MCPCRYFPQTFDPNEEHVLLKEMRFRVRHIVVCLLLQKRDEARELLVVLAELVELYAANLQVRVPLARIGLQDIQSSDRAI